MSKKLRSFDGLEGVLGDEIKASFELLERKSRARRSDLRGSKYEESRHLDGEAGAGRTYTKKVNATIKRDIDDGLDEYYGLDS